MSTRIPLTGALISQPGPTSEPVLSSTPGPSDDGSRIADNIRQVQAVLMHTKRYFTAIVEDIVKPSIKTFLETCDTNPRTAAIVATPALLAFMIVLTFFVLSTLVLVLWSILTISIGVAFVIIGGVMSLFFKLLIVLVATIPLAGVATGLLVGANAASQFILNKLPTSVSSGSLDWRAIADNTTMLARQAGQHMQEGGPILLAVRDTLVALGLAANQAVQSALARMQQASEAQAEPQETQVSADEALVQAQPEVAPVKEEDDLSESVVVQHIQLVDKEPESGAKGLKRRAPFPNVGDDADEQKL